MADDTSTSMPRAVLPPGSTLAARYDQTFPTLTEREIERVSAFGEARRYRAEEALFRAGDPGPGMFVVLSGHVAISQRDGLGHVTPVAVQGRGQFLAEVSQLSGGPALVDGLAEDDVEALLIPPARLRDLLIAEAELGERITRALILRRVGLIESNAGGFVIIGSEHMGRVAALQNLLDRNGMPHHLLDPEADPEGREWVMRMAPEGRGLPLVVLPDGQVLSDPSEKVLGRAIGMMGDPDEDRVYDVAVVGAGPAGLATCVYGASEGLSIVVLDARAYGGQAGASARIENYLGFPTGISGQALTGRAFVQAQKFGAQPMIPLCVTSLDCSRKDGAFALTVDTGQTIRAKAVVVASGARYRRPGIDRLSEFEGRGVWYWASASEARLCAGETVILVGGGNSAGQAAVFLSAHARQVKMMVRADGLAASMSKYLIDRIAAAGNIELVTRAEVVGLDGHDGGLKEVRWRDHASGEERKEAVANLFLFAGAEPATAWLDGCGVETDKAGFVITGQHGPLQSSVPGVFAVGDVRSGSVKRVGGAIGEGAQVVAALHGYLADAPVTSA